MIFNLTPISTMNWLHNALVVEKKSLKEFDIIQEWRKLRWLPENCMRTELLLFRTHFYIFHQLYALKRQLLTQGQGNLDIHTLGTFYMDKHTQDHQLNAEKKTKELN